MQPVDRFSNGAITQMPDEILEKFRVSIGTSGMKVLDQILARIPRSDKVALIERKGQEVLAFSFPNKQLRDQCIRVIENVQRSCQVWKPVMVAMGDTVVHVAFVAIPDGSDSSSCDDD